MTHRSEAQKVAADTQRRTWQIKTGGFTGGDVKVRARGSYEYFEQSVERLGIFTDTKLRVGGMVDYRIKPENAFYIQVALDTLMADYKGVTTESDLPFYRKQYDEMVRVLEGGVLFIGG